MEHYQQGGNRPFKIRPIEIKRYKELIGYSISFDEHAEFYNFYDSEETIRNFINLFKLRFLPSGKVQIKCTFAIVSFKPTPADGLAELTHIRVWSVNIYSCVYFNEYVKENIQKDIKRRVINNSETGSSWRFKRFNHLNMYVHTNKFSLANGK